MGQGAEVHLKRLAVGLEGARVGVEQRQAGQERYRLAAAAGQLMNRLFVAAGFAQLTVRDRGDRLTVRFGWIPLIGWSARWEDIESAEIGRTSWVDGWGLHWLPGRGMTINIWGQDCVVLNVKSRIVRVGTDDPEGLAEYVRRRISEQQLD